MQKISKQLTTFIDHRQKGESLWEKKFEKTSVIKFKKKELLGLTEIKFRKLVSKNQKHRYEKRVSLIHWERVISSVSEMHLRVPVAVNPTVPTVDLNWTCHFCAYGNGTVGL